ncbi:MAG TPA: hypothetical protein VFQ44_05445 [Streptosporangiaceae bacterium]|nr:hypothetical protein [Streptosporangiaceae bacterium]
MTKLTCAAGGTLVDGIDLDAVVTAARNAPGVEDLSSGPWGGVVTYLPGRQVPGVRVTPDHVVISLRGRWGVPAAVIARQVRAAVAGLVPARRVDLVLAEVGDPQPRPGRAAVPPDGTRGEEVSPWMTSSAAAPGASSSAPVTPTEAVIPPRSPPD